MVKRAPKSCYVAVLLVELLCNVLEKGGLGRASVCEVQRRRPSIQLIQPSVSYMRSFCYHTWAVPLLLFSRCVVLLLRLATRRANRTSNRGIGYVALPNCRLPVKQPRSMYHALHDTFETLRAKLPELVAQGYDAVQLCPAQLSPAGDLRKEWYWRYQPLGYKSIDPALGGKEALKRLCEDAQSMNVLVVADCVFDHTAVVATRHEWEAAQTNTHLLNELKSRLDATFGPELNRNDFQWPWICLEGAKWDDPDYMYEGWGDGEWSKLRWSNKVLDLHFFHLALLLDCGVRGFRLDAAKHMRPRRVERYVDFLRQEGAWVYVEVLSLSREVHENYTSPTVPSTDYPFASQLRESLRDASAVKGLIPHLHTFASLSPGSVRFVRSHDTILNSQVLCGIDWHDAQHSQVAWAYLTSLPEGCVLVHEDDANNPTVQRALAFRREVAERALCYAGSSTNFMMLKDKDISNVMVQVFCWPPPSYYLVIMLLYTRTGHIIGMTVLNFSAGCGLLEVPRGLEGHHWEEVCGGELHCGRWQPKLTPSSIVHDMNSEVVLAGDARFFVATLSMKGAYCAFPGDAFAQWKKWASFASLSPILDKILHDSRKSEDFHTWRCFTLLYFSGWARPHLHFCHGGQWTKQPGWAMCPSAPPPGKYAGHVDPSQGRWWRIDIPVEEEECSMVKFVPNDGRGLWDHGPKHHDYLAHHAGIHILEHGFLSALVTSKLDQELGA